MHIMELRSSAAAERVTSKTITRECVAHAIDRVVRSGSWLGGDRDGITLNAGEHRPKDDAVKRHHGVPIQQSGEAPRLEEGGLAERTLRVAVWNHTKIQERLARQFHLCAQGQRAIPFDADHTPEVEGVAVAQEVGMPTAPAQPRPTCPLERPCGQAARWRPRAHRGRRCRRTSPDHPGSDRPSTSGSPPAVPSPG